MRSFASAISSILLLSVFGSACGQTKVLIDQVGYETHGTKQAIISGLSDGVTARFEVINDDNGETVYSNTPAISGNVAHWPMGPFWTADFSVVTKPGHYLLRVYSASKLEASTCTFAIEDNVLERETLSNVLFYFKGQRASGDFDRADRHLAVPLTHTEYVDVHGGWYDATGDYGLHLSHQNLTSYFNPQQTPLVVWTLLNSYELLRGRKDENFNQFQRRLLDEGLYGADFLVRLKRPGQSFFESVSAPGRGKLAKDREIGNPNWRTIIKTKAADSAEKIQTASGPLAYQASFRSGAGMSIAALALASSMPEDGEFDRQKYLDTAKTAFDFLNLHNKELLNDGKENILDDYCALLAATELYRASHEDRYREAADRRADNLLKRLASPAGKPAYWIADEGQRPFFHPSDAGLPVVALVRYLQITDPKRELEVRSAIRRSLEGELAVTEQTPNPFGYARQNVRMANGSVRSAFFFPHDTEAAPWWQGENARIASLAAAARLASPLFPGDVRFRAKLQQYAENQLHWILGRNPYDASLLVGSGHGTPQYMFFRSYEYASAPGAILNGITSAQGDEDSIAFNEGFARTGKDEDWRWTEEWLPHAAWFMYAVSLNHR